MLACQMVRATHPGILSRTNSRHMAMSRSVMSAVLGIQNESSSAGLAENNICSAVTSTSDWHI
ncbi:hypothetical protein DMB42_19925 [Nonomuraea sp. WAC 01424]|nr:hypothetical protein DMB42_19925 [Nonomuraea sp. WAC 01424]